MILRIIAFIFIVSTFYQNVFSMDALDIERFTDSKTPEGTKRREHVESFQARKRGNNWQERGSLIREEASRIIVQRRRRR